MIQTLMFESLSSKLYMGRFYLLLIFPLGTLIDWNNGIFKCTHSFAKKRCECWCELYSTDILNVEWKKCGCILPLKFLKISLLVHTGKSYLNNLSRDPYKSPPGLTRDFGGLWDLPGCDGHGADTTVQS